MVFLLSIDVRIPWLEYAESEKISLSWVHILQSPAREWAPKEFYSLYESSSTNPQSKSPGSGAFGWNY